MFVCLSVRQTSCLSTTLSLCFFFCSYLCHYLLHYLYVHKCLPSLYLHLSCFGLPPLSVGSHFHTLHYGTKPGHIETSKIYCSTSEGVSKVCERMSKRSRGRERSKQSGASVRVSAASERANGRASAPVLTSLFLFVPDNSALSPDETVSDNSVNTQGSCLEIQF